MKTYVVNLIAFFSCFIPLSVANADEDIYGDYRKSIQKPADANPNNVYSAYADNMANLIISGRKDGIVITGEGTYGGGKVHADGVGNVTIDPGADIRGPVINQTEVKNSTIIIKKDSTSRKKN